jgi:hypothetical protein
MRTSKQIQSDIDRLDSEIINTKNVTELDDIEAQLDDLYDELSFVLSFE